MLRWGRLDAPDKLAELLNQPCKIETRLHHAGSLDMNELVAWNLGGIHEPIKATRQEPCERLTAEVKEDWRKAI
jgi:hypothetical protein